SARPAVACASASRYVALLDPSSVPTRRSSDLFFSAPIYKRLEARCPVTGCQLLTHPLPAITASTATISPPPWRILFHHHLGAGCGALPYPPKKPWELWERGNRYLNRMNSRGFFVPITVGKPFP